MDSIEREASIRNHFALINVFTMDSISSIPNWTLPTIPGAIRKAGALSTSKARVGKTAINGTILRVANAGAFGVTYALFSTVFGHRIVTKAMSALQSTTTSDRARVPK